MALCLNIPAVQQQLNYINSFDLEPGKNRMKGKAISALKDLSKSAQEYEKKIVADLGCMNMEEVRDGFSKAFKQLSSIQTAFTGENLHDDLISFEYDLYLDKKRRGLPYKLDKNNQEVPISSTMIAKAKYSKIRRAILKELGNGNLTPEAAYDAFLEAIKTVNGTNAKGEVINFSRMRKPLTEAMIKQLIDVAPNKVKFEVDGRQCSVNLDVTPEAGGYTVSWNDIIYNEGNHNAQAYMLTGREQELEDNRRQVEGDSNEAYLQKSIHDFLISKFPAADSTIIESIFNDDLYKTFKYDFITGKAKKGTAITGLFGEIGALYAIRKFFPNAFINNNALLDWTGSEKDKAGKKLGSDLIFNVSEDPKTILESTLRRYYGINVKNTYLSEGGRADTDIVSFNLYKSNGDIMTRMMNILDEVGLANLQIPIREIVKLKSFNIPVFNKGNKWYAGPNDKYNTTYDTILQKYDIIMKKFSQLVPEILRIQTKENMITDKSYAQNSSTLYIRGTDVYSGYEIIQKSIAVLESEDKAKALLQVGVQISKEIGNKIKTASTIAEYYNNNLDADIYNSGNINHPQYDYSNKVKVLYTSAFNFAGMK